METKEDNKGDNGEVVPNSAPHIIISNPEKSPDGETRNDVDVTEIPVECDRQLAQCTFFFVCCLLLFHKVRTITSHFDLFDANLEIFTIISFVYNLFQLLDRFRFMFVGKLADIEVTMKFIVTRMGYVIDKNVVIELNPKFSYALLRGAVIGGLLNVIWTIHSLQSIPGQPLLKLIGISIEWLNTTFQVMYTSLVLIILVKSRRLMSLAEVQDRPSSTEAEVNSGVAFKTQLEMLKEYMATVRMWIIVYYWLLWGYDLPQGVFGLEVPFDFFVRVVLGILSVGVASYCLICSNTGL